MAKKGAKAKGMAMPMTDGEMKPSIHLDMDDSDAEEMKGLKLGDKVKVLVTGTVKSMSMRQADSYDKAEEVCGDLCVEISDVTVSKNGKNVFQEMADDEVAEGD